LNAGPFPDVPLTVIAATDHGPFFKEWEPALMRLQQQLATLSRRATFIVARVAVMTFRLTARKLMLLGDLPQIFFQQYRPLSETALLGRHAVSFTSASLASLTGAG
jgi:hypothetical protein